MAESGQGHVWRWSDEDPEAIVPLVILIFLIIAVPWGACGPDASHGDPHPVTSYAVAGFEDEELDTLSGNAGAAEEQPAPTAEMPADGRAPQAE